MANKRKDLKIEGPNLWYLVGLIATDGCLSSDRRHIDITSKDYDFMRKITDLVGSGNKIGSKYGFKKQKAFRIQISNRNFYEFLMSVGLTPHKSLTLGPIDVPQQFFTDFFRGVIDGDGCIRRWTHPSNQKEQWSIRIYSGSSTFIKWLSDEIASSLKISGKIYKETETKWVLKYGKMAARQISKICYYKDAFGLDRKARLAQDCLNSYRGWEKKQNSSELNFLPG